jgi:hypothetical protein
MTANSKTMKSAGTKMIGEVMLESGQNGSYAQQTSLSKVQVTASNGFCDELRS